MKSFIFLSFFIFSFNLLAIIGDDDRFYIKDTKWEKLFNGVLKFNNCSAFVLEGDIVVTAAHCLKDSNESSEKDEIFFGNYPFSFATPEEIKNSYQVKELVYFTKENDPNITYNLLNDFVLIKFKEKIPENIKRFKLLNELNLDEYEIIGNYHSLTYSGDNPQSRAQKMAHLNCEIRDQYNYGHQIKSKKSFWILSTDCDLFPGASGSPLFRILKHKKTKKIELALVGMNIYGSNRNPIGRDIDPENGGVLLAYAYDYQANAGPFCFHNVSYALGLNSHPYFTKSLKAFKESSLDKEFLKKIQKTPASIQSLTSKKACFDPENPLEKSSASKTMRPIRRFTRFMERKTNPDVQSIKKEKLKANNLWNQFFKN